VKLTEELHRIVKYEIADKHEPDDGAHTASAEASTQRINLSRADEGSML